MKPRRSFILFHGRILYCSAVRAIVYARA